MKINFLLIILLLFGCAIDEERECSSSAEHYYNEHTLSNSMLMLESEKMFMTDTDVVDIYNETMSCMGLSPSFTPVIRFTDDYPIGWGRYDPTGSYYYAYFGGTRYEDIIVINTVDSLVGVVRDCRLERKVLKHEFVHFILNATGNPWHHDNPLFEKCGQNIHTDNGQVI